MSDTEEKYFDQIADGYEQLDTGTTPVRQYSELFTVLELLDLDDNQTVLELACSDGYFSRAIMRNGAGSVLGIDLSPAMIQLAMDQEAREPLGIEYRTGDIFRLDGLGIFDTVFTPFVMSYAKGRQELLAMCQVMFRHLKPGGQLLSMNDHPGLPVGAETSYRKYGKVKRALGPLQDGALLEVSWLGRDRQGNETEFSFNCHYFTRDAFEWALEAAGFVDVQFHEPKVAPAGLHEYGVEYWQTFLEKPLLIYIEARKPA